jgi:hypothetical protein
MYVWMLTKIYEFDWNERTSLSLPTHGKIVWAGLNCESGGQGYPVLGTSRYGRAVAESFKTGSGTQDKYLCNGANSNGMPRMQSSIVLYRSRNQYRLPRVVGKGGTLIEHW